MSCDCTSEEDSKVQSGLCSQTSDDKPNLQSPFAVLEVQLSKSVLHLISTSESSCACEDDVTEESIEPLNVQCDAFILQTDSAENLKLQCNPIILQGGVQENENPEDRQAKEESLKSCKCTDTCESLKSEANINVKSSELQQEQLEYTLTIIKPEAMMFRNEIEREIVDEGFSICQRRWLQLTPEQVTDFYLDDYKQEDFAHLVSYMSSGPILVFVISKTNAVEEWKLLIGPATIAEARIYAPDSIRGKYGRKGDDMKNAVHGSETKQAAEREIHFFFPDRIIEPILRDEAAVEYLWKHINDILTEGLIQCCEEKPEDPIIWLGNWLLDNNTNKPQYL